MWDKPVQAWCSTEHRRLDNPYGTGEGKDKDGGLRIKKKKG